MEKRRTMSRRGEGGKVGDDGAVEGGLKERLMVWVQVLRCGRTDGLATQDFVANIRSSRARKSADVIRLTFNVDQTINIALWRPSSRMGRMVMLLGSKVQGDLPEYHERA